MVVALDMVSSYMEDRMQKFLKPREGLIVRHPKTFSILQKQGEFVDWNGSAGRYWRRRVKCGDACIAEKEIIVEKLDVIVEDELQTTSPKFRKRKETKK